MNKIKYINIALVFSLIIFGCFLFIETDTKKQVEFYELELRENDFFDVFSIYEEEHREGNYNIEVIELFINHAFTKNNIGYAYGIRELDFSFLEIKDLNVISSSLVELYKKFGMDEDVLKMNRLISLSNKPSKNFNYEIELEVIIHSGKSSEEKVELFYQLGKTETKLKNYVNVIDIAMRISRLESSLQMEQEKVFSLVSNLDIYEISNDDFNYFFDYFVKENEYPLALKLINHYESKLSLSEYEDKIAVIKNYRDERIKDKIHLGGRALRGLAGENTYIFVNDELINYNDEFINEEETYDFYNKVIDIKIVKYDNTNEVGKRVVTKRYDNLIAFIKDLGKLKDIENYKNIEYFICAGIDIHEFIYGDVSVLKELENLRYFNMIRSFYKVDEIAEVIDVDSLETFLHYQQW